MEADRGSWAVTAICWVEFDEQHGQVVKRVVPSGVLSETALHDVKMMAMPDCLQSGVKQDVLYQFRVREKENKENYCNCLNCYVSFKQSHNRFSSRGFLQKSIILVCQHPFSSLAFNILKVLVSVLETLPQRNMNQQDQRTGVGSSDVVTNDVYENSVLSTLEVAMGHFQSWPLPFQDQEMTLPFFGEMLNFSVPILSSYVDMGIETNRDILMSSLSKCSDIADDSLDKTKFVSPYSNSAYLNSKNGTYGMGGGSGMFADSNIVEIFKPLGLLPHLWTLWELVITGKNIIVWSPSADICSQVVTGLISLCAPFVYGGDFRPYLNPYDSDVQLIQKSLQQQENYREESSHAGGSGNFATLPHDFRLQSFNRMAQGQSMSGGSVGNCVGNADISNQPAKKGPSVIIGITNPYLLKTFDNVDAAIFLPLLHPKPLSPFAGSRQRKHSLFSSRVSSVEQKKSMDDTENSIPATALPLQRNKTAGGRIEHTAKEDDTTCASDRVKIKCPHPVSFLDIPPPPPLNPPPYGHEDNFSSSNCGCNVNRIDKSTPLDVVYERWSSVGGIGDGHALGSTLVTLRCSVFVKPDQSMLHRILGTPIDGNSPTSSMCSSPDTSSGGYFSSDVQQGASGAFNLFGNWFSAPSAADAVNTASLRNNQAIMGNMLIREHFRQLTCSLMKPFQCHFQTSLMKSLPYAKKLVDKISKSSAAIGNGIILPDENKSSSGFWDSNSSTSLLDPFTSDAAISSTVSTPPLPSPVPRSTFSALKKDRFRDRNSPSPDLHVSASPCEAKPRFEQMKSMSPSRRGASSLWLYRNPTELLGGGSVEESVASFLRRSSKEIPDIFSPAIFSELSRSFALSDTFQIYYRWRKSDINTAILLDMSQACSSLTVDELIEQFAIEKGSDILTTAQIEELQSRISMYIIAISSEHNKHCGHYSEVGALGNSGSATPTNVDTKCVCCRHFQRHSHEKGGDYRCTTNEVLDKMQDHLNSITKMCNERIT